MLLLAGSLCDLLPLSVPQVGRRGDFQQSPNNGQRHEKKKQRVEQTSFVGGI